MFVCQWHLDVPYGKQGEAVRKAVEEATLKALQGRELSLKSIKDVLRTVTQAVSAGAGQHVAGVDVEELLAKAVAGMDAAVMQSVKANHALGQQAAQALLDHYEALASGVLIGMSGAMAGAQAASPARPRSKR